VALRLGLLTVLAFSLTVGISVLTAVGAWVSHRLTAAPFTLSLTSAFSTVAGTYFVVVGLVWVGTGADALWGLPTALVAVGIAAFVLLGILPLLVGRRLIARLRDVDAETALRLVTVGWPVAMLVVFGIFIAPGGVREANLLDLGDPRACLVGFCGVSLPLVIAVSASVLVAVFGPTLVGLALSGRLPRSDRSTE
jgi:hypothetical protein